MTPDALPLVLELHGRGIEAELFDRMTGFGRLADEAGFDDIGFSAGRAAPSAQRG